MAYIGQAPTAVPLVAGDISDSIISSAKIVDGTIVGADLASAVSTQLNSIAPLQTNLATNFFLDAVDHARSVQNLSDGFVDQFEDQTGIDDDECVNETYDAPGDFYGPVGIFTERFGLTLPDRFHSVVNKSVRVKIPASAISASGSAVRVTLSAGGGALEGFNFDKAYIGHSASSGDGWDFDGGQTQLLFGTSASGAVAHEGTLTSDAVTFSLDSAKDLTISFDVSSNAGADEAASDNVVAGTSGYAMYYKDTANEAEQSTPSGYTTVANRMSIVSSIETASSNENMTLVSEPQVALSAPDSAHVSLFNQEVDTLTINTDILAWVSRSKQTFTATNATNVLNASTHGLVNTDRVMVISTAADLPNGLTSDIPYYVVAASTSTLQVALTSGGSAVTFSDDGSGTHSILAVTQATLTDEGDFDTGKATLSGTVDISGQPSDTDMTLIVQTKNNKDTKLLGQALQWS
jgi:hypothetical protein